jgi:hypothetical protein
MRAERKGGLWSSETNVREIIERAYNKEASVDSETLFPEAGFIFPGLPNAGSTRKPPLAQSLLRVDEVSGERVKGRWGQLLPRHSAELRTSTVPALYYR